MLNLIETDITDSPRQVTQRLVSLSLDLHYSEAWAVWKITDVMNYVENLAYDEVCEPPAVFRGTE